MPTKRTAIFKHGPGKQRGAALLILLVLLVVGIAAVLLHSLTSSTVNTARQQTTAAALTQARDALIGYAVKDSSRPGELPCPDVDGDGMLTMGVDYGGGGACTQYVGRLPWKTLGLPELRDGDNETLWYAVSTVFRAGNTAVLNSNTKGTLLVYNADGSTPLTVAGYNAVAVIFSPGSAIGSQSRNTVAERNNAANYLDISNSRNNASASGPFIAGAKSDTFNDQLLFITTQNLMPLVEQRVAGEVKHALANYYANSGCHCYPWADSVAQSADYHSNDGLNRGWLPDIALPVDWPAGSLPTWFLPNQWYTLIYYSVAKSRTAIPASCSTCIDNTLSVDGVSGVNGLFFMPGTPIGTLTRSLTDLHDYLEDPQNYDDANDLYVTPTSQANDRDRLYRLP